MVIVVFDKCVKVKFIDEKLQKRPTLISTSAGCRKFVQTCGELQMSRGPRNGSNQKFSDVGKDVKRMLLCDYSNTKDKTECTKRDRNYQ